jgi:ribosomal protein L28
MTTIRRFYNVVKHLHFKIADKGLLGGARIRTGNRVSEFGNKTRRRWYPSMKWVSLFSETLQARLRMRTTPRVLKAIDAIGGLDNYILGQRKLESALALNLKHAMVLRRWRQELERQKLQPVYEVHPFSTQLINKLSCWTNGVNK